MKKAAILIFGMYREFDVAIPQWNNIESFFDCDYYMSTWSKTSQKYENYDGYKEFDVTDDKITKYLPKCVYDIVEQTKIFPIPPENKDNTNYLFWHWKNVYRLMEDSKKEYDIVFLVRADSVLTIRQDVDSVEKWINNNPKDELYSSTHMLVYDINPFVFFADDNFLIGSPSTIGKLIKSLPDTTNINLQLISHLDLGKHMINIGMRPTSNHPFASNFIRPQYFENK